jgi:hypothetical protein
MNSISPIVKLIDVKLKIGVIIGKITDIFLQEIFKRMFFLRNIRKILE